MSSNYVLEKSPYTSSQELQTRKNNFLTKLAKITVLSRTQEKFKFEFV